MCIELFAGDKRTTTRWEWFVPCVFCLYIFVYFVAFLRCSVSAVLAVFSLSCSVCWCLRFLLVGRYRLHKSSVLNFVIDMIFLCRFVSRFVFFVYNLVSRSMLGCANDLWPICAWLMSGLLN